MKGNVSEIILNRINNSEFESPMKDFLRDIIGIELQNVSKEDHKKLYDSKLKSYSTKYKGAAGDNNED
jgi:hypothetical protein